MGIILDSARGAQPVLQEDMIMLPASDNEESDVEEEELAEGEEEVLPAVL